MPSLSVVVPFFNAANDLTGLVRSLANPTLPNRVGRDIQWVFVDDSSTDGTYSEIVRLADESPLHIDVVRRSDNGGPTLARRDGLRRATAPFVAFVDADDWHCPTTMLQAAERMAETKANLCSFAYGIGATVYRDPDAKMTTESLLCSRLGEHAGIWRFVFTQSSAATLLSISPEVRYGEDLLGLLEVWRQGEGLEACAVSGLGYVHEPHKPMRKMGPVESRRRRHLLVNSLARIETSVSSDCWSATVSKWIFKVALSGVRSGDFSLLPRLVSEALRG